MKSVNVSPRDLEAILTVAQHGSFRAAAQNLGLSQPAVSARVRHAEDVLGVKLFHRTTRSVKITQHGERLVELARRAMDELGMLAQEFKSEARLKRGRVTVGATPALASRLLLPVVKRFMQKWPDIEVVVEDDNRGRLLDHVLNGEVDFALMPSTESDQRFDWEVLMRDEVLLLAPAEHPLVQACTVTLERACEFPLVMLGPGSVMRDMLADAYAASHLEFKPSFETHNLVLLVSLVNAGFGFSYIPATLLQLFNTSALRTARIASHDPRIPISIARAKGRAPVPAAEVLMGMLRDSVQRTAKRDD